MGLVGDNTPVFFVRDPYKPRNAIPKPICAVRSRCWISGDGAVVYEPNSFNGPVEEPHLKEPPLHIAGDADRQPGALFRLMSSDH